MPGRPAIGSWSRSWSRSCARPAELTRSSRSYADARDGEGPLLRPSTSPSWTRISTSPWVRIGAATSSARANSNGRRSPRGSSTRSCGRARRPATGPYCGADQERRRPQGRREITTRRRPEGCAVGDRRIAGCRQVVSGREPPAGPADRAGHTSILKSSLAFCPRNRCRLVSSRGARLASRSRM